MNSGKTTDSLMRILALLLMVGLVWSIVTGEVGHWLVVLLLIILLGYINKILSKG